MPTIAASVLVLLSVAFSQVATSAPSKSARVTQVVKDVKLLRAQAAPRPASVNEEVREDSAVRTGVESRAELTFVDLTLTRLGANTIFSFNQGARNVELSSGALLLYVPKNSGGMKIVTPAVTAAITGTTVLAESRRKAFVKFILLEGNARAYLRRYPEQSVMLRPGQMLVVKVDAKTLPKPVDIDLDQLRKTSGLLRPPLASDALIVAEARRQHAEFPRQALSDPTGLDAIDQRMNIPEPTPPRHRKPPPPPGSIGGH